MVTARREYQGIRVLVTGAGGFIGSRVAETLVHAGARVRGMVRYNSRADIGALAWLDAPTRKKITIVAGDIRDEGFVESAVRGCEVVFHLAALISIPYSYVSPRDCVTTNMLGSLNVLEACRRLKVPRLVHTSTSEVYGTAMQAAMAEGHPIQAQSPYAASKAGADFLALSYHRSYGLPVVVLRPFNTYGPGQSARAVIPTIICQLLGGGPLVLGSRFPERDFTHVRDTARAFLLAGRRPGVEGAVIHIGSGRTISVGRLVETVGHLLGQARVRVRQDPKRVRPAASEVGRLIADPRKAKRLLGWRGTTSLTEGLTETIRWIREHQELYRWERHFV